MIYLTQLVYLREGQEETFNQFEQVSIPIIKRYNGRLLLRLRPQADTVIESTIETPYEVHFVEFATTQDFENFKLDKERAAFLHVKEQAIRSVLLVQGTKV